MFYCFLPVSIFDMYHYLPRFVYFKLTYFPAKLTRSNSDGSVSEMFRRALWILKLKKLSECQDVRPRFKNSFQKIYRRIIGIFVLILRILNESCSEFSIASKPAEEPTNFTICRLLQILTFCNNYCIILECKIFYLCSNLSKPALQIFSLEVLLWNFSIFYPV